MTYKSKLDLYPIFKIIQKIADKKNIEVFTIGGFVRDLILERDSKDIDILCIGSGITLAQEIAEELKLKKDITIYKRFGTAMFTWNGLEIEFVGARKESYNKDSRNPIVEAGTLVDDQNRRDFTINTLALGLNAKNYGFMIDPFNGQQDIKDGLIQTPLNPVLTFSDDPLRMLRAIRFASQLNFTIVDSTFNAIKENTHRLSIISKERIIDEFNKILLSPKPSYGLRLLSESGLLSLILPEMEDLKGKEVIHGMSHKDNFWHTLQVVDNIAIHSNNLWLRWAALLHDIAKPQTKQFDPKVGFTFHNHEFLGSKMVPRIFKRLKLPLNEKMLYVQKLVRIHLRPIALVKKSVTDSAIRRLIHEAGDDLEDLMTLCRADITSSNEKLIQQYLKNFNIVEKKITAVEERDAIRNLQPVITGKIIMDTFNLPPSQLIGEIKSIIKEAILDGKIKNEFEDGFQFLLKIGKEKGLYPIPS